jgi:hypothetical protein
MQKIEKILNIIHYCIYKLDYRLHMLSNKINPFLLLGKIPAVKKKFEEKGTTYLDVANEIWTDKRFGFGIMLAGGGLSIILFLQILSIYDIMNAFFGHPFKSSLQPFVLCLIFTYLTCHYTVFQRDKYIKYFKQFEKWSKQEKWKYGILSFCYTVGVIILFIYSFRFMS